MNKVWTYATNLNMDNMHSPTQVLEFNYNLLWVKKKKGKDLCFIYYLDRGEMFIIYNQSFRQPKSMNVLLGNSLVARAMVSSILL